MSDAFPPKQSVLAQGRTGLILHIQIMERCHPLLFWVSSVWLYLIILCYIRLYCSKIPEYTPVECSIACATLQCMKTNKNEGEISQWRLLHFVKWTCYCACLNTRKGFKRKKRNVPKWNAFVSTKKSILSHCIGKYAYNPKISTTYVVRELIGFKSD